MYLYSANCLVFSLSRMQLIGRGLTSAMSAKFTSQDTIIIRKFQKPEKCINQCSNQSLICRFQTKPTFKIQSKFLLQHNTWIHVLLKTTHNINTHAHLSFYFCKHVSLWWSRGICFVVGKRDTRLQCRRIRFNVTLSKIVKRTRLTVFRFLNQESWSWYSQKQLQSNKPS